MIRGTKHKTTLGVNSELNITFGWWWTGTNSQSSTSKALTWIQCKLGKQYLVKKFTLPWESNPGPTPIRGDTATLIASVGLKKLVAIRHYIQVG